MSTAVVKYRGNMVDLVHGAALGTAISGPIAYLLTQTQILQHAVLTVWWAVVLPALPTAWMVAQATLMIFVMAVAAHWLFKGSTR